ncbi:hypothetical protein H257_08108 [Aphanomyces astaci]|uniref:DDE Tnp4 domain-containing protein n=1 Tax=Aphanomyces astaci TaxID=112090 RepID=W4GHW9_APHAT|nr:hypothetical protein H257_08108 [Aphanomyces astaci]ETV78614.1 hypothetical protein H257_08108 [Aphanomyces astaci]|eukprot:XP_009832195.1 hypothetical protein H257_08108 [Aphanomyces astaci]
MISSSSSSEDSGSDEEYMRCLFPTVRTHRGSRPGRSGNIDRQRGVGDEQLWNDYFDDNPTYDDGAFRRRYRMSRGLFLRISRDLEQHSVFFQQRRDATGALGFSTIQKCTVAMRMLAYGSAADSIDENFRMGESTVLKTLELFCAAIDELYAVEFLSRPTAEETQHLLEENALRGFPGMIGSHFVSTISQPNDWASKSFATQQEAVRKDVERCFGVLQQRFAVLRNPCRLWGAKAMHLVAKVCLILHNMVVLDEESLAEPRDQYEEASVARCNILVTENHLGPMQRDLVAKRNFDSTEHERTEAARLKAALVQHIWQINGVNNI